MNFITPLRFIEVLNISSTKACVYYLHNNTVLPIIKIGVAHEGMLKDRLRKEIRTKGSSKATHFSFIETDSIRDAILIAEKEICIFNPIGNKAKQELVQVQQIEARV
ncbi:MAG: hypothetical protein QY330_03380 [Candidatus Dojkabacteria bacterium]|nr:MAG: hypothetical protein QY330_03380 [Candidatus Dojkabacteria bacterium]